MRCNLRLATIYPAVLLLLILSACIPVTQTPPAAQDLLVVPPACEACDQATLVVAQTQEKNNADNQAAATAEVVRANAQAALNSADATMGAVQTQDQNDANIVAAQIAATAEIERANAQATLYSAGSTQSAALTTDAIQQTQMADVATTDAQAIANQQNRDELAASTQTAVANNISTQTQFAAATSEWYADQARQREEQRQEGPIAFLWMWCFPVFILLIAGLVIWGFWRSLRIQQANQRILENRAEKLRLPIGDVIDYQHADSASDIESDVVGSPDHLTQPDDQTQQWMDEVKRKLLRSDGKDEDDNTDK